MRNSLYICFSFLLLFIMANDTKSQELNAKVNINSDKITGTNKQVFNTLQMALTEFLNTRKWTSATFNVNERIDCNFNIVINQQSDESIFAAELQISARRPVFNSTYTTSTFNFRDVQFDFNYVENTSIEFSETRLENNLTATIAFYVYVILGLDFDSFSPMGGSPYFRIAQQIVSEAQSYATWTGWTAFEKSNNRHGIISAFTDESLSGFRNLWYVYHRKGLDEMAANADRGRTTIINALPVLKEIREIRPTSILLQFFADTKLDEVVNIYSKASSQEKKEGYELLSNLYPTMSERLAPMKK